MSTATYTRSSSLPLRTLSAPTVPTLARATVLASAKGNGAGRHHVAAPDPSPATTAPVAPKAERPDSQPSLFPAPSILPDAPGLHAALIKVNRDIRRGFKRITSDRCRYHVQKVWQWLSNAQKGLMARHSLVWHLEALRDWQGGKWTWLNEVVAIVKGEGF